jgi:hypothetical protein
LVVATASHSTAQKDVAADVSHLTKSTNSAVPLMVVNLSKSLTEVTSSITKIVYHYLVWSFKNMVTTGRPDSPLLHKEKWYAAVHLVNKQEASDAFIKWVIETRNSFFIFKNQTKPASIPD